MCNGNEYDDLMLAHARAMLTEAPGSGKRSVKRWRVSEGERG
jgi:hypothetical protein